MFGREPVFSLMQVGHKCFLFVCLLLLAFSFLGNQAVLAQTGSFVLKKEQRWETYGVGGTCISGGHNMFLEDVDGDGVIEIMTGGFTYLSTEGKMFGQGASLKIWNWNGQNLTLEKNHKWNSTGTAGVYCEYASDVDGDGKNEILTGGRMSNSSGIFAQVRIWRWDGYDLSLRASKEWTDTRSASINSLIVSDVDKEGKSEIITAGRAYSDTKYSAQLRIWHFDNCNLALEKSLEWCAISEASVISVHAGDVDDDGAIEIITCGFDHDLNNSTGQLRLWKWDGISLSLKENQEWRMTNGYMLNIAGGVQGNTVSNALDVSDVDGDGKTEIVTGGFTYDGAHAPAQVRVWSWNEKTLNMETSLEWHDKDINEVKSLTINDVDNDQKLEIVTSGVTAATGSFKANTTEGQVAQVKALSWDGKTMTLKNSVDWSVDEGACAWNVAAGDVDKDGVTEIITVGCTFLGQLCDPGMRIWTVQEIVDAKPPTYALLAAVGIAAVMVLIAAFFFIKKRKRNRPSLTSSKSGAH